MPEDRPSFPFYAKDYLASARVSAMPLAAQGLYVRLIAFSWLSDGLPGDEEALRRLAGVERFEWRRVWPLVAPMWEVRDNGRLYQRKLEAVRKATTDYTEARKEAGRRGGRRSAEARIEAHGTAQPRSSPEANPEAKTNPSFAVASAVASSEATPPVSPPGGDRALFTRFWTAYPRRIGKKAAEKAFDRLAVDAALLDAMLAALAWQSRQDAWTKDGAGFVPHAATWLNGRRWEDEPMVGTPAAVVDDETRVDDAWRQVLVRLKVQLNRHTFLQWFRGTRIVTDSGDALQVLVPDATVGDWIQRHYREQIATALREIGRADVALTFVTDAAEARTA